MKILLVGQGGRESAIAKKLKQDSRITEMFFAKGNATTAEFGKNVMIDDIKELRDFAIKEQIDLTIVGPEAPLVEGIVDEFQQVGLKIFGPKARAAKLEGSKAYSKKFMQKYGVKTALAHIFDSYTEACEFVKTQSFPLVIKASGLAGGKGVVICDSLAQADAVLNEFMIQKIYGDAGIRVIIEEFLEGFETSIIAFSNGKTLFPCIPVKDYKKVSNGDQGQNTGGMGSVAPCPFFTDEHMKDFEQNILQPTINGLEAEFLHFKGVIFFGLMVTKNGTYLLEYNMRLGDPETQCIMTLMENNLVDLIQDCISEKDDIDLRFSDQKAVCLVLCSGGYPRNYETGFEITGLEKVQHSQILFAGAEYRGKSIITTGGRVLNLVATGNSYEEARKKVYEDALPVKYDYEYYRDDIGKF